MPVCVDAPKIEQAQYSSLKLPGYLEQKNPLTK